jgi:membrane protein implicated in regulation of membrane protease activity
MSDWAWWLIAAVVFAVGEILTTTLIIGPFGVGALAAMVADLAGAGSAIQIVLFLAVSVVAFGTLRPIARRHRHMPPSIRTGTAALIGHQALVLEDVTRDAGKVKLDGEVWSARSYQEDVVLAAGERVNVIEIRGAIALVAE